MNWKSTAVLVVLAAAAGVWLWKGDAWLSRSGPPAESPSLVALNEHLAADRITRIEVPATSGDPLVLEKAETEVGWRLPGNWPLRRFEVDELVGLLSHLHTRFQPVPLDGVDLSPYGLAAEQKPLIVKVMAGDKPYTLAFGEAKLDPNEPPFARPAYVRVNDFAEVVRLGPDVLPILRRSPDSYRRRQLFPDAERLKVSAAEQVGLPSVTTLTLLGDKVKEIEVAFPGRTRKLFGGTITPRETVTLRKTAPLPKPSATERGAEPAIPPDRLADVWEIAAPARDRIDPEKLQKILTALPDLWVEEFVGTASKPTDLDKPERTLTVTRDTGEKVVVHFGAVARTTEREETVASPPPMPGLPPFPMTRKVTDEYRFAKLADNPQVIVVKADKFADVFAAAGDLRDTRVARFAADEVQELTVAVPGRPPLRLLFRKGNAKAATDAEKADRWFLDRQPEPVAADTGAITELLSQLSSLRASEAAAADADPKGGIAVTVLAREKRAEGDPAATTRTYTFAIGLPKPGAAAVAAAIASAPLAAAAILGATDGPLTVQLAGWPRVYSVNEAALPKLLERPALAYRRKQIFDTATKLEQVAVVGESAFTLKQEANTDGKLEWKVTAPFAASTDASEASRFVATLSGLDAAEWVTEGPIANLIPYGLVKPVRTITLSLPGGRSHRIEIGGTRPDKPEVFARLDGGTVFSLPAATADQLSKATALGLLDTKLISIDSARIKSIRITRPNAAENITLIRDDKEGWKVEGQATPPDLNAVLALTDGLGKLRIERIADYGPAVNWDRYWLAKPTATFTVALGGDKPETHVLKVGVPTSIFDFDQYVRVDEGSAVGALNRLTGPSLDLSRLDFADRTLAKLAEPDTLTVERNGKSSTFTRIVTAWKQSAPKEAEIESDDLADLARRFTLLRAEKLVADKPTPEDLKKYGFDKPRAKWTATVGKESVVLLVGDSDGVGRAFAMVEKGNLVGLLPAEFATKLLADYRTRRVWELDEARVETIEVERGGTKFKLARKDAGWEDPAAPKDDIDVKAASELITTLGSLKAERFASEDFKSAGLEKPSGTITLTLRDGMKFVLLLGGAVDGGKQVFARVGPAASDVFVLSEADAARLTRDRTAYLKK